MVINGRERHFLFNVKAYKAVSRMCRNNDLSNIGELFEGGSADNADAVSRIAIALNDAYIHTMRTQGVDASEERLTMDELDAMTLPQWAELSGEVNNAMMEQGEIHLTENKKKAEAEA